MSRKVKDLLTHELADRLKDVDAVAVINPRGIDANRNNQLRGRLREQGVRMTVVKNTLARRALGDDSPLKGFDRLLDGPSAVIYGEASIVAIARTLVELKKDAPEIEFRGAFFDGDVYVGEEGVERVSKLPTREEAIGQLLAAILSPGRKLAGAITAPGSNIAAILKTIEQRAKENEGGAEPAAAAE